MRLQRIQLPNAGKALDMRIDHGRSYILTKKNQNGILFCVTHKPSWHIKLPFQPSKIEKNESGLFICGYHHIKDNKGRSLIRPNLALLKRNAKLTWHKTFFTEDKFNGHCLIWEIVALPNDECIIMLIIEMEDTYTLKHIRLSNAGEIIWEQALRSIQINPLYFYPQKITPRLFRKGPILYNVGAYVLENSPSATSIIGIDIDEGSLKGTFKSNITNAFYTAAVQAPNGYIATAWQPYGQTEGENGILLLSTKLKCVGEHRTPICAWSGMSWNGKSLLLAGRYKAQRRYHPAVQQIGSNKFTKTFTEHNLASHVQLCDTVVTYLDKAEQEDPIHRHALIVRNIQTDWIYRKEHASPISQPILKQEGSHYSVVYSLEEKDTVLIKLS